jgi:glycosyltransferase involved in cell wall biosynthesis
MQNHEILVSIGVPSYNSARFLGEALTSAFAQTHRNLEVLVYNDGSTDASPELARACDDPRLTLIDVSRNAGVALARQVIKTLARGDYLTWLDADDRFHPRRIEVLLAEARDSDADLVIDNSQLMDEGGRLLPGEKRVPDAVAADPWFTRIFERNAMLPHPLVSRRCFSRIDYDPRLRTSEDYDYWLRCSLAGFVFHRVDRALLDYRITAGSLSSDPAQSREAVAYIFSKFSVAEVERLYRERGFSAEAIDYMACLQHIFRGQYPEALARAETPWPKETGIDQDFYLGSLALQCSRPERAEPYLRRHLERHHDSPAGHNNLGVLLRRRGKDGSSCWTQALELFPSYSDALANLAGQEALTLTQLPPRRHR